MSADRLLQLAARKAHLVERVRQQRVDFAGAAAGLERPSHIADRALLAVQYLKRHPMVAAGVAAAIVAVKPRAVLRLVSKGWVAWRIWGSVKGVIANVLTMSRRASPEGKQ